MTKSLPYQTLAERLKSACKILFGSWIKVMLFPLFIYLFVFLISKFSAFLETSFPKIFDNLLLSALFSLFLLAIVIIAFFIPNISILWSTNEIVKNKKITTKNQVKNSFSKFSRYLKISAWILVYLGTFPLIAVGISTLIYTISPLIGNFFFALTKVFTAGFFLVRLPRVIISFPLGITEPKLTAKEIVQKSRDLSKGHLWQIFGNLAVISIISFIITSLGSLVEFGLKTTLFLSPKILTTSSALIDILFQTHVLAFTLIFLFLLTKQYQESK